MKTKLILAMMAVGGFAGCKARNPGQSAVKSEDGQQLEDVTTTSEAIFRTNMDDQMANLQKSLIENPIPLVCQTLALLYQTKGEFSGDEAKPWLEKALTVSESCAQQNSSLLILSTQLKLKLGTNIPEDDFKKILEEAAGKSAVKNDLRDLQLDFYIATNKLDLAQKILETQLGSDSRSTNWISLGKLQSAAKEFGRAQESFQRALSSLTDPNPWVVAHIYQASAQNFLNQMKEYQPESAEYKKYLLLAKNTLETSLQKNPRNKLSQKLIGDTETL